MRLCECVLWVVWFFSVRSCSPAPASRAAPSRSTVPPPTSGRWSRSWSRLRARPADAEVFGRDRSRTLGFARLDISVPPERAAGDADLSRQPAGRPAHRLRDARRCPHPRRGRLPRLGQRRARPQPPDERRIMVFVHGFNTNFAEGVYRHAQMMHDFGTPAIGVHYSWPSAADARLYLYDRDSAFFARDGLERLLRLLAQLDADRIVHRRALDGRAGDAGGAAADGADRGAAVLREAQRRGAAVAGRRRRPVPQRAHTARLHGHPVVHLRLVPRPGAAGLLVHPRPPGAARVAGRRDRHRRPRRHDHRHERHRGRPARPLGGGFVAGDDLAGAGNGPPRPDDPRRGGRRTSASPPPRPTPCRPRPKSSWPRWTP